MPKATREPPKRTRCVESPLDDRIYFRCYSTEKAALHAAAKDRGLSVGDLIRFQLGDLMAADPPKTPDQGPQAAQEPPTDLAEAIAERFGCTVGHALLKIKLGKVRVNGEVYDQPTIDAGLVPLLTVDG